VGGLPNLRLPTNALVWVASSFKTKAVEIWGGDETKDSSDFLRLWTSITSKGCPPDPSAGRETKRENARKKRGEKKEGREKAAHVFNKATEISFAENNCSSGGPRLAFSIPGLWKTIR